MSKNYGSQSMIAPLRRVLVKRPDKAFAVDDPTLWHYTAKPNLEVAQQEHDALVASLRQTDTEVIYHDQDLPQHADAIYTFDPALVTDAGAVMLSLGKELRRGEEDAMVSVFEAAGVPIHYRLHGEARAEGGDLMWIDHDTLAVGLGFRTNAAGVDQLREALNPLGVTVIPVELPYFNGPDACLHLLSMMSIVDEKLIVVYPSLISVPFWQYLEEQGFHFIEVPPHEFETMGPNVLALAPGLCLMLEGNSVTQQRLMEAGCEVLTYRGHEISLKAEGGATCLTRPIWREV